MKSGVVAARRRLPEVNAGWSDADKAKAQELLEAEEERQAERTRETARRSAEQIKQQRDSLAAEAADIVCEAASLRQAVAEGRIPASNAGEEFAALRRRHDAVREQGAALVERLPGLAWQYENPLEAADRLTAKFPSIQTDWPW